MEKLIPILPCTDIRLQADFYKSLGFELVALYTHPNPYAVLRYGEIELHFFGNKRFIPSENPAMCVMQADEVDKLCEAFSSGLKAAYGKIPRTGIPKITKVRDLADDRRFTLTDPGGNTIYVCTPNKSGSSLPFRSLEDDRYAEQFALLYDLLYSKEDRRAALKMLSAIADIKSSLSDADLARFLFIEVELLGSGNGDASALLQGLLEKNRNANDFWKAANKRYSQLLNIE